MAITQILQKKMKGKNVLVCLIENQVADETRFIVSVLRNYIFKVSLKPSERTIKRFCIFCKRLETHLWSLKTNIE